LKLNLTAGETGVSLGAIVEKIVGTRETVQRFVFDPDGIAVNPRERELDAFAFSVQISTPSGGGGVLLIILNGFAQSAPRDSRGGDGLGRSRRGRLAQPRTIVFVSRRLFLAFFPAKQGA
jgi:hypothetical protein